MNVEEMTKEEKEKFFEENYSPLIRYGYATAIKEISDYIVENSEYCPDSKELVTFTTSLQEKLNKMIETKKQVNSEELRLEFVEAKPKD